MVTGAELPWRDGVVVRAVHVDHVQGLAIHGLAAPRVPPLVDDGAAVRGRCRRVRVAVPCRALDDRTLRPARGVDQLDGELLDRVQVPVASLAALGETDDEPAVGHPRRRADIANRLQVAADRHLAWRAVVGGDRERLAWLRLAAALEGDALAVRGPVGLAVDEP